MRNCIKITNICACISAYYYKTNGNDIKMDDEHEIEYTFESAIKLSEYDENAMGAFFNWLVGNGYDCFDTESNSPFEDDNGIMVAEPNHGIFEIYCEISSEF